MIDTRMPNINKALQEMEAMMPLALVTDVVKFEQCARLYAAMYCMKLRIMK